MTSATIDQGRLRAALEKAIAELLAHQNAHEFWEGELSGSALSTATAVTALAIAVKHGASFQSAIRNPQSAIDSGLRWLAEHQNADGGWGDTTKSLSNISTTTLCWATFGAAQADENFAATIQNAERWLAERVGVSHSALRTSHSALAQAIIACYGKDRTFSVPILTMCALAGRLGSGHEAWRHVIPLPFELAACPHQLFAALRLPVVSYALPALIAIGQARHVHAPSRNPFARLIRNATREKTLRVLTAIQPSNGGFLEATPLTSFVTMSLAGSGQANHIVTQRGLEFLLKSQRADGSWPIDTNLSTWCTTLAVEALDPSAIVNPQSTIGWLLNQQYKTEHPYTHAAPGGWAWTDLPGGVPDADDAAGALVALARLQHRESAERRHVIKQAAKAGIDWLLKLQNRDGGIPTFCRGWGALPFDRSSPDITAHVLRAWLIWSHDFAPPRSVQVRRGVAKAVRFLIDSQRSDGTWVPLWFGNEFNSAEENPVYGTSRVIRALALSELAVVVEDASLNLALTSAKKGINWLLSSQKEDGSWGESFGSIEETSLAVRSLAQTLSPPISLHPILRDAHATKLAVKRGTAWLIERVENNSWREPFPIGFYFAKLWYFERLYPLIFTVGALRAAAELDV